MTSNGSAARPTLAHTHQRWKWRLSGMGLVACLGLTALIGKQAQQAVPAAAQGNDTGGRLVSVNAATVTADASMGQGVDFVCTKPTCVIVFADPNGQIAPVQVAALGAATDTAPAGAAPIVQTRTRASR